MGKRFERATAGRVRRSRKTKTRKAANSELQHAQRPVVLLQRLIACDSGHIYRKPMLACKGMSELGETQPHQVSQLSCTDSKRGDTEGSQTALEIVGRRNLLKKQRASASFHLVRTTGSPLGFGDRHRGLALREVLQRIRARVNAQEHPVRMNE